jgi:hypothetical protein
LLLEVTRMPAATNFHPRGADREHWARTISRWYRTQHVVDFDGAVRCERDTGGIAKWGYGFAN